MEAAAVAASAAAAAAKEAALAASVAAAAAAQDAAVAAATAKETSVAASAANEAALAASVAAAAAAKDAAVAAATAKEASAAAKEVVAAAAAAALNAREAAVAALAAASDAKEAASAGEAAAAAAAAMRASKKRRFHLIDDDGQDPPGNVTVGDVESVDFISRLPDAVLGSIVSLLPTKDGVRTQAISRRWRPLWRSAPLNLVVNLTFIQKGHTTIDLIQKIISEHPGPGRRFSLGMCTSVYSDKIQGWLRSQALNNLQELELTYDRWYADRGKTLNPLPSSVFHIAPTLRVAEFGNCSFPGLIVPKFPRLKQLTLDSVTISEDALQSMLSGCTALESLELKDNLGIVRLCISSKTLKSLGFCADRRFGGIVVQELVIEDTPCLERLLPLDPKNGPATIRVISAPKLKILGMLSEDIAELQFGTNVFQKMVAVGLTTRMHTVRVLVLDSAGPNLGLVVNFLKCFPCLKRLYVIFQSCPWTVMNNVRKYDPLDPIECFELHLEEVVLKNYDGTKSPSIDFANFFVLNVKVLKQMKIKLPYHRQHKWFANQHRLLKIQDRASKDARIELKCGGQDYFTHNKHTHDLSMADPFDMPFRGCYNCSQCPF